MSNLREDFGELYSQVNELYVDETKQRVSQVISVLIDEGYSDSAINCYFESQDNVNIVEKYTNISESYEIPEQNIDRVGSLYQEGWAGRLAKNLFKHSKTLGKGAKNFVTGGKKAAKLTADDAVHGVKKTLGGNNVSGSNWKSGANPAGKPAAKLANDSLGKQIKDTTKAAKQGVKNNKWGTAAAGVVGTGLVAGALTGGEDANKKAMEKLKKDKAELDKKLKGDSSDTGSSTPKIETPKPPKEEKGKFTQSKVKKPKQAPAKKKANVPDGIARGIAGAMDIATGNLTDFDQRGGKPFGMARVVAGIADKLTGDRTDFDKRGASKLNAGQKSERDKNYVKKTEKTPVTTPEKPKSSTDSKSNTGLSFADAIKLANQMSKDKGPKAPPKPTNPSGKELPKAKEVKPGSARANMIARNKEMFGGDKIDKLRSKNAAFQAAKKKGSGYSMDDFVKDFPNSNTAKKRRASKRVTSVMDMESVQYEPYDIVLDYLLETNQVETAEEANYVMLEMDSKTIQDIVNNK